MRSTRKEELGQIPCNHGIDQSTDDLGAPVGAFRAATNMRIRAGGLLEKRPGTYAPGMGVFFTDMAPGTGADMWPEYPSWMARAGDAGLVGMTQGFIYAFRPAVTSSGAIDRWSYQGNHSTCKPVRKRHGDNYGSLTTLAACCINADGFVAFATINNSGTRISFRIESPDGFVYRNFAVIATRAKIVPCGAGNHFILVWQQDTTINAMRVFPDGNPLQSETTVALGTLTSSSAYWDVSPYSEATFYLVYQNGAAQITIANVSVAGTSTAPAVVDTANQNVVGTIPVSIFGDPDNGLVWVGRYDDPSGDGDVIVSRLPASLNSAIFTTLVSGANIYGPPLMGRYRDHSAGGPTSSDVFCVFRNARASAPLTCSTRICTIASDGTASDIRDVWGCLPISKPDNYNRVWAVVTNQSDNQLVTRAALLRFHSLTMDADDCVTVELATPQFPNYAGPISGSPWTAPDWFQNMSASSGTVKRSVFGVPVTLAQAADARVFELALYEYETTEQSTHKEALSLGSQCCISGQPVEVLGDPVIVGTSLDTGAAELGFCQVPTIIDVTPGALGGSVAAGTYSWRVACEWVDMLGRRHLSAPSPPVSASISGANNGATVRATIPTLGQRAHSSSFSLNNNPERLVVYRTAAGGTTYHAVGRVKGATTDGTLSFSDTFADSSITDEEPIYTDGGVLQNDLAPACRFMCKSEDRLWCGGLWDRRVVQCSKVMLPTEPPTFTEHESHQVILPDDCTGLAYQDGQVIAFCERSIYLISGDGPNSQGFGGFPPPRGYSQDLGCNAEASVLETRIGVIFKSQKGYYLIPRGFGPLVYIGAQIRDELETNGLTKVYAAAVHGGNISAERYGGHLARWLVGTESSTYATNVLTFDIDNGQWFKDTLNATNGRMLEMGAWPDGFALGSSDMNTSTNSRPIWYETGPYVGDASNVYYVPQRLQTASYQPFGPLGYGRIKRVLVGMKAAPTLACRVTLNVTLDENETQTATWTIPTGGLPQYRELPLSSPQMCSTLRIAVEDSALDDVVSPGVKLVAIGFEADDSDGFRQLELTERA